VQPDADWLIAALRGTAHVYPHHAQLWFTARALQTGQLRMPDDARGLIESVFGDEDDAPAGLRGNANRAEGKVYGDRSLAQLNSVKPDVGYERRGNDWMADSSAPSRLGEDTQEVLLARWVGDRIEPWIAHEVERFAWAYSSVRVPRRLIHQSVPPMHEARQAALEQILARLPGGGRFTTVLPFETAHGRSTAQAWGQSAAAGGQPKCRTWRYDPLDGLRLENEAKGEEA